MVRSETVQNNYANSIFEFSKEGRNVLFNDALNTFYVRLYGVSHNFYRKVPAAPTRATISD